LIVDALDNIAGQVAIAGVAEADQSKASGRTATEIAAQAVQLKVPFVPGLVCFEEDPSIRVVTSLVDCRPEDLVAGMPVSVVFRPLTFTGVDGEVLAPLFRPDDGSVAPSSAAPESGH
jgi:hypothetical protein